MLPTERILARLYGGRRYRGRLQKKRQRRAGLGRALGWLRGNLLGLGLTLCLLALWVLAHLYYYNKLIDMEYNIQEAWAQVETQWQRRYHIQQSVTRVVLAYARHERQLLVALTRLRMAERAEGVDDTKAPPAPAAPSSSARAADSPAPAGPGLSLDALQGLERLDPEQLNKLFPQIQLMAEQYPKLRLTENFQQFSTAIIDTETQIAQQIQEYNKRVNSYTTVLKQFPGNIFGKVCGFKPYRFYEPDRRTLPFEPVVLDG